MALKRSFVYWYLDWKNGALEEYRVELEDSEIFIAKSRRLARRWAKFR